VVRTAKQAKRKASLIVSNNEMCGSKIQALKTASTAIARKQQNLKLQVTGKLATAKIRRVQAT